MREILLRGKFGDAWKYGYLTVEPNGLYIKEPYENGRSQLWRVDPVTVGQYTGSRDKNGKRIFEGDIIEFEWDGRVIRDVVVFKPPMFSPSNSVRWSMDRDRVIGNIHDNPELLLEA